MITVAIIHLVLCVALGVVISKSGVNPMSFNGLMLNIIPALMSLNWGLLS